MISSSSSTDHHHRHHEDDDQKLYSYNDYQNYNNPSVMRLFGFAVTSSTTGCDQNPVTAAVPCRSSKNNNKKKIESKKRFECQFCGREFANSQALGGHQNAHKTQRKLANKKVLHTHFRRRNPPPPPPPPQPHHNCDRRRGQVAVGVPIIAAHREAAVIIRSTPSVHYYYSGGGPRGRCIFGGGGFAARFRCVSAMARQFPVGLAGAAYHDRDHDDHTSSSTSTRAAPAVVEVHGNNNINISDGAHIDDHHGHLDLHLRLAPYNYTPNY